MSSSKYLQTSPTLRAGMSWRHLLPTCVVGGATVALQGARNPGACDGGRESSGTVDAYFPYSSEYSTITLTEEMVREARTGGGPITGAAARHYIRHCLLQLKWLHDAGVIHGDLHMHTVHVHRKNRNSSTGGAEEKEEALISLGDVGRGIPISQPWGELVADAHDRENAAPPGWGQIQHPPELWTRRVVLSPKKDGFGHLSVGTRHSKKWSAQRLSPEAVVQAAEERSEQQRLLATPWQALLAAPSHDVWSAGMVLYTLLSVARPEAPLPETLAQTMVDRIELEGGGTEGARGVLEFALKPFARWERRLLKMMLEPDPTKRPPVGLLLHFLQDGTPSSGVKIPAYNNGERES